MRRIPSPALASTAFDCKANRYQVLSRAEYAVAAHRLTEGQAGSMP